MWVRDGQREGRQFITPQTSVSEYGLLDSVSDTLGDETEAFQNLLEDLLAHRCLGLTPEFLIRDEGE